ncbi:lipase member M-like [Schistocerca cancellata]|uniref:lipase member M-like n=1 Tax=Schistocerca cancellata TaxID=274614 RepID=UPI0021183A0F|nr:lipase member M-like [Schistocerca cancellata]
MTTYTSVHHTVMTKDDVIAYPVDFLSSLELSGVPSHKLELKAHRRPEGMEPASVLSAAASLLLAALNLTSPPPPGSQPPADPAVYATMTDGCRDYGLTCEAHTVETEDGYQLTAHRVPVPPGVPRRGALLAVSGLIGCSDNFLLPFPEKSMLKPLSNAGYDVVLGNLRGSAYAGHRRWSRSQPEYWRFK